MILRPSTFLWQVDELAADQAVYHLTGRLYGAREGYAFQEEIHKRTKETLRGVVLDFAAVDRIDSCGIGILASVLSSVRNAKGALVLAALPSHIAKLLDAVWFLRVVEHCETVTAALERIKT
jgi:anti-anti-sigma factor